MKCCSIKTDTKVDAVYRFPLQNIQVKISRNMYLKLGRLVYSRSLDYIHQGNKFLCLQYPGLSKLNTPIQVL